MNKVMSACGVICSDCAAYVAASRGLAYQKEAAGAWSRIYGFQTQPEKMSCGGCLSSDEEVFHTSINCTARRCCLSKGLKSCAECPDESCERLARAQANWDTVPEIGARLSASDFEEYARPYCGHRERLAARREEVRSRAGVGDDKGRPTGAAMHKRQDHEPPSAIAERGWRFHHLGIPTTIPRPDEVHLPHLKIHVSGFDTSPYGIEWIRFDPDCAVSDLVRTIPHVAFEVDDLDAALVGQTVLGGISSPSEGVRVAMIADNGAPVELLEFSRRGR